MKTLASSRSLVGNNSSTAYFPSFLKERLLFGPQIVSCRRPWRIASSGFQNSVSVRCEGVEPLASLPSEEQLASSEEDQNAAVENQNANQSRSVHVKFQLQKECTFGEQFLLVGDDPMFGSWDVSNGIPLTWSDGHQWEAELDIPVGKTIQFKFVLQEKTGNIVWQPDPDRTFQSWETNNTIIVCEDWDSADSQMLMEEQIADQNKGPPIAHEMLIVAENLTNPSEELVHDKNEKQLIALIDSSIAQKPWVKSHIELINDSNISVLEEDGRNLSVSEENGSDISASEENSSNISVSEKNASNIPLSEENASNISPSKENAKAITKKLENPDVDESVISYGVPILVPGLPPISTMSIVTTPQNDIEDNVPNEGVDKSVDYNIGEMDQKQGPYVVAERDTDAKKSHEDDLERGMREETDADENPSDMQPFNDNILQNDMMWSHRTLLKFFTNLRLL